MVQSFGCEFVHGASPFRVLALFSHKSQSVDNPRVFRKMTYLLSAIAGPKLLQAMRAPDKVYVWTASLAFCGVGLDIVRSIVFFQCERPSSKVVSSTLLAGEGLTHVCPKLKLGYESVIRVLLASAIRRTVDSERTVARSEDDEMER